MESEQKGKGLITLSIVMILIVSWEVPVSDFKFMGYAFGLTDTEFGTGWICVFAFFTWRYALRFKELAKDYLVNFLKNNTRYLTGAVLKKYCIPLNTLDDIGLLNTVKAPPNARGVAYSIGKEVTLESDWNDLHIGWLNVRLRDFYTPTTDESFSRIFRDLKENYKYSFVTLEFHFRYVGFMRYRISGFLSHYYNEAGKKDLEQPPYLTEFDLSILDFRALPILLRDFFINRALFNYFFPLLLSIVGILFWLYYMK